MSKRNPFVYPVSMGWIQYMATEPPGTMIWLVLENAKMGEKMFAFVIREQTDLIKGMPKMPSGGVPVEFRSGMMFIEVTSGIQVPMLVVMMNGPGGISEMTINALHIDDEALKLVSKMISLIMIGDSGSVERSLIFPPDMSFANLFIIARGAYKESPWTDYDFDEAKMIYESNTDLSEMWEQMGQR